MKINNAFEPYGLSENVRVTEYAKNGERTISDGLLHEHETTVYVNEMPLFRIPLDVAKKVIRSGILRSISGPQTGNDRKRRQHWPAR